MNQSNIALQQFLTSAGCVCPTECAEKATVGYVNASQQSHIKTGPISINIVFFYTHLNVADYGCVTVLALQGPRKACVSEPL